MPTPTATPIPADFDPTALIALILSIVGILVTIFLRYLDGPRVRVRLQQVLLNVAHGSTVTYHIGKWPIPVRDEPIIALPDPGEVVELAEIIVENSGRHPVTVYGIGLSWRGRKNRWGRRQKHSSTPTPLQPYRNDGRVWAAGDQFRIEPSDMITVLVDYWPVVRHARPDDRDQLTLRAIVQAAGRRRPSKSSLRLAWRIPNAAISGVGAREKLPVRAVVSRATALMLMRQDRENLGGVDFLARILEAKLDGHWSASWKENHDRVKELGGNELAFISGDEPGTSSMVGYGIVDAIDDYKEVIDWGDIKQPALKDWGEKSTVITSPTVPVEQHDSVSDTPAS